MGISLTLGRLGESALLAEQQATILFDAAMDGRGAGSEHVLIDRYCDLADEIVSHTGELSEAVRRSVREIEAHRLGAAAEQLLVAGRLNGRLTDELVEGLFLAEGRDDLRRYGRAGERQGRWADSLEHAGRRCWTAQRRVDGDLRATWHGVVEVFTLGAAATIPDPRPTTDNHEE